MTLNEFSDHFDILVNSYRRFRNFDDREAVDSIEFDEYEKSLYLTKAQEEIVLSLYNGKNAYGESFELTEELRRYLSGLLSEVNLSPSDFPEFTGISPKSVFFTLPEDLWFITYEAVTTEDGKCEGTTLMDVIPVTQDEYHRVRRNPFRGTNERRCLRLDYSGDIVEIVCDYPITSYYIRYVKDIHPIILEDLPNGLSIDGFSRSMECELHEGLHQKILERAVQMALQSKGVWSSKNINRE